MTVPPKLFESLIKVACFTLVGVPHGIGLHTGGSLDQEASSLHTVEEDPTIKYPLSQLFSIKTF